MKSNTASSIKRTGSANNLSDHEQLCGRPDSFFVSSCSPLHGTQDTPITSPPSPAAPGYRASTYAGSIKRTGSVNNIASNQFTSDYKNDRTRGSSGTKKTSEIIASLSKSGVMMFVDERNLSRIDSHAPPGQLPSRLSPGQFFRSSKRSSSSNRCPSDEPRPCGSVPEDSTVSTGGHQSPPLSRSLPPSPQHSPPRSRKVLPLIIALPALCLALF